MSTTSKRRGRSPATFSTVSRFQHLSAAFRSVLSLQVSTPGDAAKHQNAPSSRFLSGSRHDAAAARSQRAPLFGQLSLHTSTVPLCISVNLRFLLPTPPTALGHSFPPFSPVFLDTFRSPTCQFLSATRKSRASTRGVSCIFIYKHYTRAIEALYRRYTGTKI